MAALHSRRRFRSRAGLYPGATFRVELTPDKRVILIPIETKSSADSHAGATCGA